jgi:hypothetical protein
LAKPLWRGHTVQEAASGDDSTVPFDAIAMSSSPAQVIAVRLSVTPDAAAVHVAPSWEWARPSLDCITPVELAATSTDPDQAMSVMLWALSPTRTASQAMPSGSRGSSLALAAEGAPRQLAVLRLLGRDLVVGHLQAALQLGLLGELDDPGLAGMAMFAGNVALDLTLVRHGRTDILCDALGAAFRIGHAGGLFFSWNARTSATSCRPFWSCASVSR